MRFSLVIVGIDPGLEGAISVLADGCFRLFHDMPLRTKRSGKDEIDGARLSDLLQGELEVPQYENARWIVGLEYVNAMPPRRDKGPEPKPCPHCKHVPEPKGMGVTSAFSFGEGWGEIRGILAAMRFPHEIITPQSWKKTANLIGTEKSYARSRAAEIYPTAAPYMRLKKHHGRADSLLIAHHIWLRERAPIAAQKRIESRVSSMPGATVELF